MMSWFIPNDYLFIYLIISFFHSFTYLISISNIILHLYEVNTLTKCGPCIIGFM